MLSDLSLVRERCKSGGALLHLALVRERSAWACYRKPATGEGSLPSGSSVQVGVERNPRAERAKRRARE
jgi:hypothetical protein